MIDNGSFNAGRPDFTVRHRDLADAPVRLDERCHDNVVQANCANYYDSDGPVTAAVGAALVGGNHGYGLGPWNRSGETSPYHCWVPGSTAAFIDGDTAPRRSPAEEERRETAPPLRAPS